MASKQGRDPSAFRPATKNTQKHMKMTVVAAGVAVLWAANGLADGISLVVQNDYFTGTDRGYTDGTEVMWTWAPSHTNTALILSAVGVRNRMYSPDSTKAHPLQPTERPYCATLSAVFRVWRQGENERIKYEVEAGVLGPHAYGKELQTWAHRQIQYRLPQGWDDQLQPDEPILNLYMERWHPLEAYGDPDRLQARLDGLYGGALGTTFINGVGGFNGKAGWNIPGGSAGSRAISNAGSGWFAFAFVEPRGRLVLLNATLGKSLFHDRGNDRVLVPLVGELEGGVVMGWRGLSLTYSAVGSTQEYQHQNQKQRFGNVRVDYGWTF